MTSYAKKNQRLALGRCGENLATEWAFDVSAWVSEYGSSGTFVLLHQRNGDDAPYPVTTTMDGTTVLWAVTSADVANPGAGMAELQYVVDEVIVKSAIWTTYVKAALDDPTTVPDPETGWVADLIRQIQEIVDGIEGGGGGTSVTVDSALSSTSENPVQNKVIYSALNSKADSTAIPSPASTTPAALGTAATGSSTAYARADHVHAMPTAANVGAIPAPASPTSGQFLVYNGTAWVAQTLATWSGGSY